MPVLSIFRRIKFIPGKIRLSKNIITYLICLVIASILWLMNALNKEYAVEMAYPVKYINMPEGKYPVSTLPTKFQLEIKAKGFTLVGHRIRTSFLPITFNMATYIPSLKEKDDSWEYHLNTNDIKDRIGGQLSSEMRLMKIYPEEIIFRFGHAKTRKVAVLPTVDYTLKRQYILNGITTTPDSISVSGPAALVDTLRFIRTAPIEVSELGKNLIRSTRLLPIPNCIFEDRNIEVDIRVEQFTEAKKFITLVPKHVPDSMNIRLFPAQVEISYEVGLSKYDQVTEKDFVFTVDYPQDVKAAYLDINIQKAPSFIQDLTLSPPKVEYILESK